MSRINDNEREVLTLTHWGAYRVQSRGSDIVSVKPLTDDLEPSAIGQSLLDTRSSPMRIQQPMVRASYLEKGRLASTVTRGTEPFVPVDWETAVELAASALLEVKETYGNSAIYGGSYGWSSAGRFHHAQSQIHRFLKSFGGYTDSRNTYSMGAMEVIVPHVLEDFGTVFARMPSWRDISEHTKIVLSFGGLALKNTQVNVGGVARHNALAGMNQCADKGVRFVNVSPIEDDVPDGIRSEWVALRPNSDTALMLGMAFVLITEDLIDRDFLNRCCVGFETLKSYIMGDVDGLEKTPEWAARLSEVPVESIVRLARDIARQRCFINVSWSVQRGAHGEQPVWMAIALAAMAGSMGFPGGGVGIGQNSIHSLGHAGAHLPAASLPQGDNPVKDFIPVARLADMLMNPGAEFDYNGQRLRYPDIQLIYWAGGNPFHHHQDLGKLVMAWRKPQTIIVHEPFWTPLARFSDIVFPCATMLERNDIGVGMGDGTIIAMKQAVPPPTGVLTDYETFSLIAKRLGFGDRFTEGLNEEQWLRQIYALTYERCQKRGLALPDFDTFWEAEIVTMPSDPPIPAVCAQLRADPAAHPLPTPSGKVELFSSTIAAFCYNDCPGHPTWIPPYEWLGASKAQRYPLHLISNQPSSRLHSQLDFGRTSMSEKLQGREPCDLNRIDAEARNIRDGDLVRLFNDRGSCISVVRINNKVRHGVVKLSTGAWYDPEIPGDPKSWCLHGNPNVLTCDVGTSRLAQATTAHSCLIEIERLDPASTPLARPHQPPIIADRG